MVITPFDWKYKVSWCVLIKSTEENARKLLPENKAKSGSCPLHEGIEREQRNSPPSFLTQQQMGLSGQLHAPATLLPGKEIRTHFIGGWVIPVDDMGGYGGQKNVFAPVGIRNPDRPVRRVEKLFHIGHVQYTFLLSSVQKNLVINIMASRLLRHFNYDAN